MGFLSLGRGFADEFMVSDFAEAAWHGDIALLEKLIAANPENLRDPMALYLALRAKRKDVFRFLLEKNIDFPKSIYGYVLFEDESFLELLPPDEEELRIARARQNSFALSSGLLNGKITAAEVRRLVYEGADARNPVLVSYGTYNYFPVHLAARHPDLKIMKELVRAGVDPTMLSPEGKNAVRMVYENGDLSRKERKEFVKLFRNLAMEPVPALTILEKIRLHFGLRLTKSDEFRTSPRVTSSSDSRSS